jgi:hypothetical protein
MLRETGTEKDRRGRHRPIGAWQFHMLPAATQQLTAAQLYVAYILVLIVFAADVSVPHGTATSCLYLIPLGFLTLWSTPKQTFRVVLLGAVCAIFTGVGFLQSHVGPDWIASNRVIAVTLIIVTTLLALLRKRTEGDVKILRGLLPICSYCKKIRDKKGFWQHVERYIAARSEADFSHGMCPECGPKHFPEIYAKNSTE